MKTVAGLIFTFLIALRGYSQIDSILTPVSSAGAVEKKAALSPKETVEPKETARPAPHLLSGDELLGRLEKQIVDYYSLKGVFKLEFARPWRPVKIPAGDFETTITDYPGGGVSSAFLIRCKIASGGETIGEWQLSLRGQLWQETWGTQSRLDRGQPLDRSMLAVQKVDVLRDKQAFLPADVDPAAYDMAQSVPAGHPLIKRDVTERPLVRKGQVVEVVARQGLLSVRMKALALEDGIANGVIKMRNPDSRKEFNAQIINENQVLVNF